MGYCQLTVAWRLFQDRVTATIYTLYSPVRLFAYSHFSAIPVQVVCDANGSFCPRSWLRHIMRCRCAKERRERQLSIAFGSRTWNEPG